MDGKFKHRPENVSYLCRTNSVRPERFPHRLTAPLTTPIPNLSGDIITATNLTSFIVYLPIRKYSLCKKNCNDFLFSAVSCFKAAQPLAN